VLTVLCDNSTKIVNQALSFQPPDRLPVFDNFWEEFEDDWRRRYNLGPDRRVADHYWTDLAICTAEECFFPTRVRTIRQEGEFVYGDDGWGRTVRTRRGAHFAETIDRLIESRSGLDRVRFDPPDLDQRYTRFVESVHENQSKGRVVFAKIGGPFIRSTFIRGEVDLLVDFAEDEEFSKALIGKVGEHLLAIGLESLRRAELQDTGVWIFDDMCNVNAPMFSPRTFERVFLPVYRRMVSQLKQAGARWVGLHCDGNLYPFLDMLVDAGINGINPVEPNASMDVTRLVRDYWKRLWFVGGLCNSKILPSGDPDRIRRHVEAVVEAARDGGIVIGSHTIGPDITVDSYELYRRIVAERGSYRTA